MPSASCAREDSRAGPTFALSRKEMAAIAAAILLAMSPILAVQCRLTSAAPVLLGNEGSHVELLIALVHDHTFRVRHDVVDVSVHDGAAYSNKPPGYPFLLALPYALAVKLTGGTANAFHFAKAASAVFSALAVVVAFLVLATFRLSRGAILFGVVAASFGTIFPAYTVLANSIPLSVLLCLAAFLSYRLFRLRGGSPWWWGAALLAASTACITDYANAFFLLPLAAVMARDAARRVRLLAFAVPALVPVGLLLFYNAACFGSPFALSYSYYRPPDYVPWESVRSSMSLANVPRGAYGLLLSPSRGLFLLSPVALLGAIASWRLLRGRVGGARLAVLMALSGILLCSSYSLWHGGHCVGYRHILQSAVLLGMLSAFFFEEHRRRLLRGLAVFLLGVSVLTGGAAFLIDLHPKLVQETWKSDLGDVHAGFYTELVPGLFGTADR